MADKHSKTNGCTSLYLALDAVIRAGLPETSLYYEIGHAICACLDRGAAVMAAEYLWERYPDKQGFSPRRMWAFYLAYSEIPNLLTTARKLGWMQNVAILEGCETSEQRAWYLNAVMRYSWTKAVMLKKIRDYVWQDHYRRFSRVLLY